MHRERCRPCGGFTWHDDGGCCTCGGEDGTDKLAARIHEALRIAGEPSEYVASLTGPNDPRHDRTHDITWWWHSRYDQLPDVVQERFKTIARHIQTG